MKRIALLLVLLPLASACFAQADQDVASRITVLSSPEARTRATDRDRLVRELTQVVSFLHVSPQRLPNIVIIYADDVAQRIDALPAGAKVTVARINIADASLYQVWIAGTSSDANAVQGMVWALNRHFELHLSEPTMADVRDRVVKQMTGIVSVNALSAAHH